MHGACMTDSVHCSACPWIPMPCRRMAWETMVNVVKRSKRMRAAVTLSSHAEVLRGRDEGSFHAVDGSETRLSVVKKLVVVEVFSEASIDDFL